MLAENFDDATQIFNIFMKMLTHKTQKRSFVAYIAQNKGIILCLQVHLSNKEKHLNHFITEKFKK